MSWQNANRSNSRTVPSYVGTNPTTNVESADDFDVQGTVTRILIAASGCFNCARAPINGVWVRFYQWNAGNPGSLQYQAYVPSMSSALIFVDASGTTVSFASAPVAHSVFIPRIPALAGFDVYSVAMMLVDGAMIFGDPPRIYRAQSWPSSAR